MTEAVATSYRAASVLENRWFSSYPDDQSGIPISLDMGAGLILAWVITSFTIAGVFFAVPHGVDWKGVGLGLGTGTSFILLGFAIFTKLTSDMISRVVFGLWGAAAVAALGTAADKLRAGHALLERFWPAAVTTFVLPVLGLVIAALVDVFIQSLYGKIKERWFTRHPDDKAVIILTGMLSLVAGFDDRMTHHEVKRRIAGDLEVLAQTAERDYLRAVRCRETISATWLRQDFQALAAAFRALKRDVYAPTPGSWERLRSALAEALYHMARGCWGALPREKSEPVRLREQVPMVLSAGRTLLVAAVPAGVLMPALHFGVINPPHPVDAYIQAGVLIWGVVTLITAVNPELSGKVVAAIPNVTGIAKRP